MTGWNLKARHLSVVTSILMGLELVAPAPALAARCLPDTFVVIRSETLPEDAQPSGIAISEAQLLALPTNAITTATEWSTIPWSDMDRYGIILAHSQNGDRLSKRKFGPLFLMYPRDQYASVLDTPTGTEKFIWQVCGIHVQ